MTTIPQALKLVTTGKPVILVTTGKELTKRSFSFFGENTDPANVSPSGERDQK